MSLFYYGPLKHNVELQGWAPFHIHVPYIVRLFYMISKVTGKVTLHSLAISLEISILPHASCAL